MAAAVAIIGVGPSNSKRLERQQLRNWLLNISLFEVRDLTLELIIAFCIPYNSNMIEWHLRIGRKKPTLEEKRVSTGSQDLPLASRVVGPQPRFKGQNTRVNLTKENLEKDVKEPEEKLIKVFEDAKVQIATARAKAQAKAQAKVATCEVELQILGWMSFFASSEVSDKLKGFAKNAYIIGFLVID
ncbi:hypothetical protein ACH5RR_008707 [Cinchona calisaya]|uniref:Uncharacterized protein n=1 Tax=Cinchona calisaya TaxID=153742 RepID=A0ABD3AC43_9GENT